MKKIILSLIASVVLILVAVIGLQNEKVVDAADNLMLLEKKHPGYWEYLRNRKQEFDTDCDGKNDVTVNMLSKTFLQDTITSTDYKIFSKDAKSDTDRRFIYFYDGTGIDVNTSVYGNVDTNSWNVIAGHPIVDVSEIKCEEKPINEITDLYEYLEAIKNYSFIISARDDAANFWNRDLQHSLEDLGLLGGFKYRDSYIAVVQDGKVLHEQVSHDPLEYTNKDLYVKSAGYDTGVADSVISIDSIDYSVKGRGLNIVVFMDENIIDSIAFDTSESTICARRK